MNKPYENSDIPNRPFRTQAVRYVKPTADGGGTSIAFVTDVLTDYSGRRFYGVNLKVTDADQHIVPGVRYDQQQRSSQFEGTFHLLGDAPPANPYPDPTKEDLDDPIFNAVWQAIKGWDIERALNEGRADATGNDVMHILNAIRAPMPQTPPATDAHVAPGCESFSDPKRKVPGPPVPPMPPGMRAVG